MGNGADSHTRGLAARGESHAGRVTRFERAESAWRWGAAGPRRGHLVASRARNPLGGGPLRPSAVLFVGEDIPYHRPPHASPNGRRSPPRDPRDFHHGLLWGRGVLHPNWDGLPVQPYGGLGADNLGVSAHGVEGRDAAELRADRAQERRVSGRLFSIRKNEGRPVRPADVPEDWRAPVDLPNRPTEHTADLFRKAFGEA